MRWAGLIAGSLACLASTAVGEPWRMADAVDAPDWLSLSGETRLRYESLDGQYRAGRQGSDQIILSRSTLLGEVDTGAVTFGIELQDGRGWLDDAGTPVSNSFVNALDVLQAYADIPLPGLLGDGSEARLRVGRQTIEITSGRQIDRPNFANVARNFTGIHATSTNPRGDELHGYYAVTVRRRPEDREGVVSNRVVADKEAWQRRVWGVHYRKADMLGPRLPGLAGEVFVHGLDESDAPSVATPNRSYVTPGLRLHRAPVTGQWDMDVEAAYRFGARRASSDPGDIRALDVSASSVFAAFGYTFDMAWQPRFAVEYYWASGDRDPTDGQFGQFERLFNTRRGDLGNTSLHGPLTPENISTPGWRLEVDPGPRWDARIYYHAAHLAARRDAWSRAGLVDPTGQSGSFLGHALDGRVRYWLVPGNWRLEMGGSLFTFGRFAETVAGGPEARRSLFGYGQVSLTF